MAKRPLSTSLTCPGCAANFDREFHIPYVGSCGDSICAVCINEKKTKTCPVCNKKQSFTSKKKNNLAVELLAMMTQDNTKDSKGVKLDEEEQTNTSNEVVPTLLDPKNRMYLLKIVNQLDPKSFLRLSRCCKELHMICFDTRLSSSRLGKDISVMYDIAVVEICSTDDQEFNNNDFYYKNELAVRSSDKRLQYLNAMAQLDMLKRYPFVYRLEKLEIYGYGMDLNWVRSFLSDLSIHTIAQIEHMGPLNWNIVAKIFEDYHCKDFECSSCDNLRKCDYKSFDYVLHQTNSFKSDMDLDFPKQLLLEASVPKLEVYLTSFSKNTFMQLVKKFTNRADQIEWTINTEPFHLDVEDFIAYKLFPHDYTGILPEERPLLFVVDDDFDQLWFLREDENVLGVFISDDNIAFRICAPNEYPLCLCLGTVWF